MRREMIVLIGPPCSGKSTVGKILADKIGARYISSGDIARAMAKADTIVKDSLNGGLLAPENRMRDAIYDKVAQCITSDTNIVLDGFPRFGDQAEWLNTNFRNFVNIKYVLVYTKLSTVIERSIRRNRSDDKSLERRLGYYYNVTLRDLGKYIEYQIDTDELSVEECVNILIKYVEKEEAMECH